MDTNLSNGTLTFESLGRAAFLEPGWQPDSWTSLPEGPTLVTMLLILTVVAWRERQWWGRNELAVARQRGSGA